MVWWGGGSLPKADGNVPRVHAVLRVVLLDLVEVLRGSADFILDWHI